MFTVIDHSLIKEWVPFLVGVLYMVNGRAKLTLRGVISLVFAFPVLYLVAHYFTGFTLSDVLTYTWRNLITPIQYAVFTSLNYFTAYHRSHDHAYSVTVAVHLASASGYLYEVPRFLFLQGVPGLLRFNKYSPFLVDYAILSIPIIYTLYQHNGYKVNSVVVAGLATYFLYCGIFYLEYTYLFDTIRREIIYCLEYVIPWINLYRIPTMVMLWSTTMGINIYTGTNIYTVKDG